MSSHSGDTTYFLRSQRLGFRCWREDDLPLAISLWGDPEVTKFIDTRKRLSNDDVKEILDRYISMQQQHGIQYWPIFLLESGEHVGCSGLRPRDLANGVYELGVHICASRWRQHLAEEAASAVIDYAFGTLMATGLFAGHNPNNNASRSLLCKLGFRHTHDEYYPATGLEHPSYFLKR